MSISYFLWWIKYRGKAVIPRIWSLFWWKNTIKNYFGLRDLVFFIFHGFKAWERWDVYSGVATYFLKISYWMSNNTMGIPSSFLENTSSDPEENNLFYNSRKQEWMKIINKIRFSFFYVNFIVNDYFSWMINSNEDKKNCLRWARKKFWYMQEFLTDDWWNSMYTPESFMYTTKLTTDEKDSSTFTCTVDVIHKNTKEVVNNVPPEIICPHLKLLEDLKDQYIEGLDLFKQYYLDLWD